MTKKLNTYFVQQYLMEKVRNGGIGNVDVEKVLLENGAKPIAFPAHFDVTFAGKVRRLVFLLKIVFRVPSGAYVFFQYPYYARMTGLLLRLLGFRRNVRLVCIVAEINGLKYGDAQLLKKEKKLFRRFPFFIVHNEAMQRWLQPIVPRATITQLSFFDYLAKIPSISRSKEPVIVYAGNLAESAFLEKLGPVREKDPELVFNIYGEPVTDTLLNSPHVSYQGVFEPYELPLTIKGSFGLVWDGEGVAETEGVMAHYMEYISHHKVSLYILCGLPLIIYEKAGAAALVRHYGIGITIRNLFEIGEKIRSITPSEYEKMHSNCRKLALKIATGGNLATAYREVIDRN